MSCGRYCCSIVKGFLRVALAAMQSQHCKSQSGAYLAAPQGIATHFLSNQAVMIFRGLRNIEAAFFNPAWFVLSSVTRAGCTVLC